MTTEPSEKWLKVEDDRECDIVREMDFRFPYPLQDKRVMKVPMQQALKECKKALFLYVKHIMRK